LLAAHDLRTSRNSNITVPAGSLTISDG
jgi:hypothetical protein